VTVSARVYLHKLKITPVEETGYPTLACKVANPWSLFRVAGK
jgi:hypothetical protein